MQTNSNQRIRKTLSDIKESLGKGLKDFNVTLPQLKVSSQKTLADLGSLCLFSLTESITLHKKNQINKHKIYLTNQREFFSDCC